MWSPVKQPGYVFKWLNQTSTETLVLISQYSKPEKQLHWIVAKVHATEHLSKWQHIPPLLEVTLQNLMELKRELTFHYLRAILDL